MLRRSSSGRSVPKSQLVVAWALGSENQELAIVFASVRASTCHPKRRIPNAQVEDGVTNQACTYLSDTTTVLNAADRWPVGISIGVQ